MGCFWKSKNNQVCILNLSPDHPVLLHAKNALITKHQHFVRVRKVKSNTTLDPEQHQVIKERKLQKNYCSLCTKRLISLTSGCKPCSFVPNVEFSDFDMDSLIEKLKELGFYEVDQTFFNAELKNQSKKG